MAATFSSCGAVLSDLCILLTFHNIGVVPQIGTTYQPGAFLANHS